MTGFALLNPNKTVSKSTSTEELSEHAVHQARRKGLFWVTINLAVISAVFIGLTQSNLGYDELWPTLRGAHWGWLFTGWALMNLAVFVLGYRWHALLPKSSSISGSFLGVALSAALLLNYAIPGPFGELAAAWFVSKRSKLSVTQALVAGSTARLIGLLSAAVGAVCLWPLVTIELDPQYTPIFQVLVGGMAACSLLLGALILLPSWFLNAVKTEDPSKGKSVLINILEALLACRQLGPMAYLKATFWSVVGHVLAALGVYAVVYAVFGGIDGMGVVFSYLTMTCSSAFAFLVPGSQWPWDAVMATMLGSTTDLSALRAGTAALLLRVAQLAMMGVGVCALQVLMRTPKGDS